MNMNQKGFANIILIVVIVILLGAVGYFAFVKKSEPVAQQPTPTPTQTNIPTPTPAPNKTANWKTYNNTQYGFQFKYPPNLDIKTITVSGPGGEDHQFYIQGLTDVDSNNPPRLVGVLYPARFTSNQEQLLSFNQNPTSKTSGFTEVEKDFFNLGEAIFHGGLPYAEVIIK